MSATYWVAWPVPVSIRDSVTSEAGQRTYRLGGFDGIRPYTVVVTSTVPDFDRLTVEPGKLGGQPCIRGYRFSAKQLLDLLAAGKTFGEIQANFEFLEIEDLYQVLGYAAALADRDFYLPTAQPA